MTDQQTQAFNVMMNHVNNCDKCRPRKNEPHRWCRLGRGFWREYRNAAGK